MTSFRCMERIHLDVGSWVSRWIWANSYPWVCFRRKTAEFFTCTALLLTELILIIFGCMQQLLKSRGKLPQNHLHLFTLHRWGQSHTFRRCLIYSDFFAANTLSLTILPASLQKFKLGCLQRPPCAPSNSLYLCLENLGVVYLSLIVTLSLSHCCDFISTYQ